MNGSINAWQPEIDWETPAGEALTKLCEALPAGRDITITVFGSAPLQLAIEASFKSNDVDVYPLGDDPSWLEAIVHRVGLAKSEAAVYIQCCWEGNFRTSPRWRHRAANVPRGNATLLLPHPIDILIAKLHRYEEKDRNAFRLVIERTGHPSEQEFLTELQFSVDLFRPGFDEEVTGDITTNTAAMWPEIFGREIDVRREIIAPALARLRAGYADDLARRDYKADLRHLGEQH
jgi:hypothetical protein